MDYANPASLLLEKGPLGLNYSGWAFDNAMSYGERLKYSTTVHSIQQRIVFVNVQ